MSITFNYKNLLLVFLVLNFGLSAKSASERRARCAQRTINTIARTVKQINKQYHVPFTILNLNDQSLLANALVSQARQDYWFFKFARFSKTLQRQICKLKHFSQKTIFNRPSSQNQALLAELSQTICNLEKLLDCLTKTPEYAQEINRYIKLRHFGLFVATVYLFMTAIVLFCISYVYLLIALLAPYFVGPSHLMSIGLGYLVGGAASLYVAIKCQKFRKKDHLITCSI